MCIHTDGAVNFRIIAALITNSHGCYFDGAQRSLGEGIFPRLHAFEEGGGKKRVGRKEKEKKNRFEICLQSPYIRSSFNFEKRRSQR